MLSPVLIFYALLHVPHLESVLNRASARMTKVVTPLPVRAPSLLTRVTTALVAFDLALGGKSGVPVPYVGGPNSRRSLRSSLPGFTTKPIGGSGPCVRA